MSKMQSVQSRLDDVGVVVTVICSVVMADGRLLGGLAAAPAPLAAAA
jgi:hypothetical protein